MTWSSVPLRRLASLRSGAGFPIDLQGLTDEPYPFYKVSALGPADDDGVIREVYDTVSAETASGLRATILPAGTLVMAKIGAALNLGRIRMLARAACIDNNMLGLVPRRGMYPRYLFWALHGLPMEAFVQPGAVPSLSERALRSHPLSVPSAEEQVEIADFLDRETAKIDALIEKQHDLVRAAEARMAALIARELEEVGLRDSGPRLKHYTLSIRQGWSPQCNSWPAPPDGWAVLRAGCINDGVFHPGDNKELPESVPPRPETVVREGELVVSRANTRDRVGSAAVVTGKHSRLMLSDKLYSLRLHKAANPWFVAYAMSTRRYRDLIELDATGASYSMQNISQGTVLNLPMRLPSRDAQDACVLALAEAQHTQQSLATRMHASIELAQERRAALITAAVTAQLDIGKVA